ARGPLLSLALRPAPVTDGWLAEAPALTPTLPEATAGLTLLEAPGAREEEAAIAWRLRRAAEAGARAALVTPDRDLSRRVAAALARWGIEADDSAGRPLGLTPPGILLRLLAGAVGGRMPAAVALAILKHPLVGGRGAARGAHLGHLRGFEAACLRGQGPDLDWGAARSWAARAGAEDWIRALEDALVPLEAPGPAPLDTQIARLGAAAEGLSRGLDAGAGPVWEKAAGEAARALLDALAEEAPAAGPLPPAEVARLLERLMAETEVRPEAFRPDPGIVILGALEARLQGADLMILGGLAEGVWPAAPAADPWLNRPMRESLGLPLPERQIGLAAHDFQTAAMAPEVILSRPLRTAGGPTVASRWLVRLEELMAGMGKPGKAALKAMRARGAALLTEAGALDRPAARVPPEPKPAPRPPEGVWPRRLSVTEVETLIRDPYAIYARRLLGLAPLDPPGRAPDPLSRGIVLHAIMARFVAETAGGEVDAARLLAVAEAELAKLPWPAARRLWRARLAAAADYLIGREDELRAAGHPLAQEVKGRLEDPASGFTLIARADRIDRFADGLSILDYKTGSLPSKKQIKAFAKQMPLEAAIAAAGGFAGIEAAPVRHLELLSLGGGGSHRTLDPEEEPVPEAWPDLLKLLATYRAGRTGYVARARPQRITYASDFDHLARRGEWDDGDSAREVPVG
ncbi:MAG: double-strand break repair protein AddB, partial [Pseudomonadota bacterium]